MNPMKKYYATLFAAPLLFLSLGLNAQGVMTNKVNGGITPAALVNPAARPNAADAARGGEPSNDLCSSAAAQVVVPGAPLVLTGTTVGATNAGDAVPSTGLDLGGDTAFVFHRITLTGCTDLTLAYCGTTTLPSIYQAVLATTCPMTDDLVFFTAGGFADCADGNATLFFIGVPAGTYYIPVRGEPATAGPYTITVTATACPTPPANDECGSAVVLVSSAVCNPTPFTTLGATQSRPPILCATFTSSNAFDAWFSFVCTSATQTIGVVGFNAADAVVEFFSGANCNALTSVICADATFPATATATTTEIIVGTGLMVGTTYFVRVYDYAHLSDAHNFEICVTEGSGTTVGINERELAMDFNVYPNPSTGLFQVAYTGEHASTLINVVDVMGRAVYTWTGAIGTNGVHTMDLTGIAAGNYTAQFTVNGVRAAHRVVIK